METLSGSLGIAINPVEILHSLFASPILSIFPVLVFFNSTAGGV